VPNLRPIFVDPDQVDVLRGVGVGAWTHTWVRVVNAESAGELCWDCEGSVDPAVRVHDTTGNAIHDAVNLVTNELIEG